LAVLLNTGRITRKSLGLSYLNIPALTPLDKEALKHKKGAIVISTDKYLAATNIKANDIITSINGNPLESDLAEGLLQFKAGQELSFTIDRNGKTMETKIKLREQ